MWTFDATGLEKLFKTLEDRGYKVVGPTVREQAIVYDELGGIGDLPVGWGDDQDRASYRLRERGDGAFFGYNVGPHSWKRFLFPPRHRLWRAERGGDSFRVREEEPDDARYAFFGVRPCELQAIAIQDRVFLGGEHVDPVYRRRRNGVFLVVVQCAQAGGTCFCTSMGTGPRATGGFDVALTEVQDEGLHVFVAEAGSDEGRAVLAELPGHETTEEEGAAADRILERTAARMGRELETAGLRELLYRNTESPRWDEVAGRCLACGNCTLVCPTCFCSDVEDVTDLSGTNAERWRKWDSCFTADFSYLHGGSVRTSTRSRYRQWATHKLASWIDQFGTSGCVGCGRCITWCPVGIDITEEALAIRESERRSTPKEVETS